MPFGTKLLMATNVFLYRISRGAIGGKMAGQSVLLLNTVGRKSGKVYTTPLNYYRDQGNLVVVASNWGQDRHPAWFINLRHLPDATIQLKDRVIKVSARQAEGDEYERLWCHVAQMNPFYTRYQQQTRRKIPLVILAPEN
jgi:F420H(2)-dependent quinone reductase